MNSHHVFVLLIFNQTDGKKSNIRALLCSLHTVLWDDAKWQKCEMHQLITPADVKKAYRKACLAVHPDKVQTNEQILSSAVRDNNQQYRFSFYSNSKWAPKTKQWQK